MRAIKTVAVIDDDDDAAETIIGALEDGDFTAFRQEAHESIEELVNAIVTSSDAAVCDHRLRYGGFADISGADLASRLVLREHPTILVTQYLDQDADIAIRSYRPNLPVVLRREDADEPDELRDAFARCVVEITRGRKDDRIPQLTLLEVLSIEKVNGAKVIDAVVHGWHSSNAVRFPMSLVKEADRDGIKPGDTLSAMTNLRTEKQIDLYFEDVKLAPAPDPNDGLE
ncbi:hypothetical protein [Luteimonas panaciterrae]|uniref:hypothetical protein n=1 Tax=Luteimonas panaciterrae TaxID=363885 RepID=UPI001CF9C6DA|nr:hypothetical protein [Luteimonas panaciterrae]